MAKFRIVFQGRTKGAIGAFEVFEEIIEAEDAKAAHLKLYDSYDHVLRLHVEKVEDPAS